MISAVIVTRGDVDLQPILDTIPFEDVVIWDNSVEEDFKTYGRWKAVERTIHPVTFFQDDDILFHRHEELLESFELGRITTNMPSPWWENGSFEFQQLAQFGGGSYVQRGLCEPAFNRYLAEWPEDELFHTLCDLVAGMLTPFHRVDLGFEILPSASWPGRISTAPGNAARRNEMTRRLLAIRASEASTANAQSPV